MADQAITQLINKQAVIETILQVARAMDTKDWPLCRTCFVDEIEVDYSDFRGQPPQKITADEYVSNRQATLTGVKTLHTSTNHLVMINGDSATCSSNAVIYRYRTVVDGDPTYTTHCLYTHGLTHTGNGWKIHAIKQTVQWNTGNPLVHGAKRNQHN